MGTATLPVLYRGDSLPRPVAAAGGRQRGRTFADYFVTEGLMAKFADGGLSRHLNRPLNVLVAVHVGYRDDNKDEVYAADHSPLISFSTDPGAAWHFLDRSGRKTFAPCAIEEATHFMWRLQELQAVQVAEGHFSLSYAASTENVDRFREQFVDEVLRGDTTKVPRAVATQLVHENIRKDQSVHTAQIIHPESFLLAHRTGVEPALLEQALERAKRWSEWLVFPTDTEAGLNGFSARFSLNRHLHLHLFAREAPKATPKKKARKTA